MSYKPEFAALTDPAFTEHAKQALQSRLRLGQEGLKDAGSMQPTQNDYTMNRKALRTPGQQEQTPCVHV